MRRKYLGSSVGLEAGVEGELESGDQLLVVNSGVQAGENSVDVLFMHRSSVRQLPVVGGPLLSDADSVLLDLVLGLKGTSDLKGKCAESAEPLNVLKGSEDIYKTERLGRKYFYNLSSIGCGVASGSELDPTAGLALHLQLDQAEVVACG